MSFDYSKLEGKITEKFKTQKKFAKMMDISERTLSLKLNNKIEWKQEEMLLALDLLDLPEDKIKDYFFTR